MPLFLPFFFLKPARAVLLAIQKLQTDIEKAVTDVIWPLWSWQNPPSTAKMSTKSKSTPNGTPSNSTPNSHRSVDKSVRSAITSSFSGTVRSSKISTLPDRKPTRILKPSELQAELNVAREDLGKGQGDVGFG
ncbi:hypothetical protein HAX54_013301 [Datura stramonium]|uniref:Uncharacterized protein n=1 Tax=Datura stramonium TaxID=4076 RepID=A0ABS8TL49_DATST|nr:hypothetical protein [Datura stramonium]